MTINFKEGDIIRVKKFEIESIGKVVEIKGKKLYAEMGLRKSDRYISEFRLRNDNTFVKVGWTKDESNWGGWFRNGDSPLWK